MGLNEVPEAGNIFRVVGTDKEARGIIQERQAAKASMPIVSKAVTLESMFERYQAGEVREMRLVIRADVQGSLEPIMSSLNDLSFDDIGVNILRAETGNIGENDVMLAAASQAVVLGFNVEPDATARRLAEVEGVDIRLYDIIYRLTEDVTKALKGMLEPEEKETVIGKAQVRATFRIPRIGTIAGCYVLEGEIRRNSSARVVRQDEVIYQGELASLRHHQDDVREVRQGFECGIAIKGFNNFEDGDVIESFIRELVPVE